MEFVKDGDFVNNFGSSSLVSIDVKYRSVCASKSTQVNFLLQKLSRQELFLSLTAG